jgi:hypothetical protein
MPGELVVRTLEKIWQTLEPLELPMAVMGGVGLAVWEYVRATRDVDLLIQLDVADVGPVLEALHGTGIRPKQQPPVLDFGEVDILPLLYQPPGAFVEVRIDLLLARSAYDRQSLTRRVPFSLPGLETEFFVLSCEDLIIHKLIAGRIIDRADAAYLLRIQRPTIDFPYLKQWVNQLALASEWSQIWRDAFPGEEVPPSPST